MEIEQLCRDRAPTCANAPRAFLGAGRVVFLSMSLALVVLSGESFAEESIDEPGVEFFETHIRPALVEHCYECHSSKSDPVMGGLRLDTKAGWLEGGDLGTALVPGSPDDSLIVHALRQDGLEMPPEGKLPESIIRRFAQWIEMGAPDPREAEQAPRDHDATAAEQHWAFQPIADHEPPNVELSDWVRSPIDRFVLAKMEQQGLQPVGDADRRALLRRIYFDLWGLPPEPDQLTSFMNDPSPDALAKVVDRLLQSPRFGEHWARHWLDVARYGESTGHERNFLYPHAWRYRDYVIAAFNDDLTFDRFILQQLAGDLLPASNSSPRDDRHIATGFLALGSRNLLGSSQEFMLSTAEDQINVTMRAVLGLTVSCARCHDHKFDPISTEEYYSLAGIFLSTEPLYGTKPGTGGGNNRHPSDLVPLGENAEELDQAVRAHAKLIAAATKTQGQAKNRVKKLTSLPDATLAQKKDELEAAQRELAAADQHLEQLRNASPAPPSYAMGVRDAKEIVDTQVRISGDARRTGDRIPRGLLECCSLGEPPKMPSDSSGRLELAQWIVDPRHPLTTRVAVNRIWHHLQGRGIVPTVDNFGRNGRRPSHPQLLDWLALQFQRDDWSIKRTIRRIMLSHTYQLATTHSERQFEIDPDNVTLWRASPKRLGAEAIRDALLTVSGQLDCRPPAGGSVVAELGDGCLVRQIDADQLKTDARYRSVYLPAARYFEPEILQVFDGAAASLVVGDRAETNVPAQALFLLNNDFVIEQARLAARRIVQERESRPARIRFAYQLSLARQPTPAELERASRYLKEMVSSDPTSQRRDVVSLWAGLVQALFVSAEFRYIF